MTGSRPRQVWLSSSHRSLTPMTWAHTYFFQRSSIFFADIQGLFWQALEPWPPHSSLSQISNFIGHHLCRLEYRNHPSSKKHSTLLTTMFPLLDISWPSFGWQTVSDRERGICNINHEITSSQNLWFVVHDSKGFEPDEVRNLDTVERFLLLRERG